MLANDRCELYDKALALESAVGSVSLLSSGQDPIQDLLELSLVGRKDGDCSGCTSDGLVVIRSGQEYRNVSFWSTGGFMIQQYKVFLSLT
jgi:hypothetical protein